MQGQLDKHDEAIASWRAGAALWQQEGNLSEAIGSLVERRGLVTQNLLEGRQALSLAENVEQPSVVQEAASRKTTARSVGRSLVVGGLIGLILGLLAAILWEPAERRFRPRTA